MKRPDYVAERIAWRQQRQTHARIAPPDCRCALCLSSAELHDLLRKRAGLDRPERQEVPF